MFGIHNRDNYVSSLVVAALISVVGLPFCSEHACQKEDDDYTVKSSAIFEDLLKSNNHHFIS